MVEATKNLRPRRIGEYNDETPVDGTPFPRAAWRVVFWLTGAGPLPTASKK